MYCVCPRSLQLTAGARAFSTSVKRVASLGLGANDAEVVADVIPAYPPGPTRWYKQSTKGLYGGAKVRYGNNTAEEYRTRIRRSWGVNVKSKKLYSKALGRSIQLRVTTRVLRTIDKVGGIDEYLLGEKAARIKELGDSGWWLRWAIMQTKTVKDRFAKERAALGLPPTPELGTTQASTAPEDTAQDGVNPLFEELDEKKTKLRFRVAKFDYVKLDEDNWVPTVSKRSSLIARLKALSPTASLKEWEDLEHERSIAGAKPIPEHVRLEWFRLRQMAYSKTLSQYKLVDPAEEATVEELEEMVPDQAVEYIAKWIRPQKLGKAGDKHAAVQTSARSETVGAQSSIVEVTEALEKL